MLLNNILKGELIVMKRLTIATFIIISLCVSMYACNALPSTNANNQKKDLQNDNESILKETKNIEKKETFHGEWLIKKQLASGRVSEYGEEDVNKLLDKKITYSINEATFDNSKLMNPHYKSSTISEKDFFEYNYVRFERLGIKSESIIKIEVYTDKECTKQWDSTGNMIFVKDQNTLVLYDGGVYFELIRRE